MLANEDLAQSPPVLLHAIELTASAYHLHCTYAARTEPHSLWQWCHQHVMQNMSRTQSVFLSTLPSQLVSAVCIANAESAIRQAERKGEAGKQHALEVDKLLDASEQCFAKGLRERGKKFLEGARTLADQKKSEHVAVWEKVASAMQQVVTRGEFVYCMDLQFLT